MSNHQAAYIKYVLPYRRRNQAQGRTVFNRPRINQPRPELAGIPNDSPEYHHRYYLLRKQITQPTP